MATTAMRSALRTSRVESDEMESTLSVVPGKGCFEKTSLVWLFATEIEVCLETERESSGQRSLMAQSGLKEEEEDDARDGEEEEGWRVKEEEGYDEEEDGCCMRPTVRFSNPSIDALLLIFRMRKQRLRTTDLADGSGWQIQVLPETSFAIVEYHPQVFSFGEQN